MLAVQAGTTTWAAGKKRWNWKRFNHLGLKDYRDSQVIDHFRLRDTPIYIVFLGMLGGSTPGTSPHGEISPEVIPKRRGSPWKSCASQALRGKWRPVALQALGPALDRPCPRNATPVRSRFLARGPGISWWLNCGDPDGLFFLGEVTVVDISVSFNRC